MRALARTYTQEALEVLVECIRDPTAPQATRIAAAAHILDRGYGKPTQTIDAIVDARGAEQLSDAELLDIIHRGLADEATEN